MKELIKKWWFWVIVALLTIITTIIIFLVNKNDGVGSAGISIDEFEEINLGMTQFKVNSIIDKLDEWDNDNTYYKCCEEISESSKDSIYTYVYKYYGEQNGYAIITYEVDYSEENYRLKYPEVVKKEKYNLK